jgi:hypothetical protein
MKEKRKRKGRNMNGKKDAKEENMKEEIELR